MAKTVKTAPNSAMISQRARPEILAMGGYVSARSIEKSNRDTIFLDANECAFEPFIGAQNLSRYPEQQPTALQEAICRWLDVSKRHITITRGADEAIDCLVRAFCVPGQDNIVICPPTFAMYAQSATLQNAEVRQAKLDKTFDLDVKLINQTTDKNTKIIFVCSPNNPTANLMNRARILRLCADYAETALVVVDETYVEFADSESLIPCLDAHANLVILRTLSKSHAAAGLRCGVAVARSDVTGLLQKVLAPYPLAQPVVDAALTILSAKSQSVLAAKRRDIVTRRNQVAASFAACPDIVEVLPSDANYLLVRVKDAADLCEKCRASGIILRNQSHQPGLENSVRVSIGSDEDMQAFLAVVRGETISARTNQRVETVIRKTNETAISVRVNLDAAAPVRINTGIGFYDHMLDQIAKHGGFSLEIECDGDLHIDPHHSVEDCAIALGQAIRLALGDKRGIGRYGFFLPMDESQVKVALDFGGRFYLDFNADFPESHVGDLPTDMVPHVFYSLAENMQANLHIAVTGENTHHMVEACFKGFGRALRQAIRREGDEMPSTKGSL
ncbi:MAG: histidinol-phosphate transaminase [Proteobacteria bacterium]|nr:histidinol-phosphate transaminase [Pseudomonadota bacterium]